MNRIHRTVWSKSRNALVVVSEIANSHGKSAQGGSTSASTKGSEGLGNALCMRSRLWALSPPHKLAQFTLLAGLGSVLTAYALPQNGVVTSGTATIASGPATLTVSQTSQNASLNWSSFNIGSAEAVTFAQPNRNAIALNRIADTSASQILGSLNANGQVFLVNPNGILFGAGSQVNVGGLVASTLDVADSTLGHSVRTFTGTVTGAITNHGSMNAAQGGYVALISNVVTNDGSIAAPGGTAALAAGSQVTMSFAASQLLNLTVDANTLRNSIDNSSLIQADGGQVILSAGARYDVLAGVVNNAGRLRARTVNSVGGVISLGGAEVMQTGTLDVTAPGTGATNAANVGNAGSVRIDGRSVVDAGQIDASSATGRGGRVSVNASEALTQASRAVIDTNGATHGGVIALKANNVFTSATLHANGTGPNALGGQIDASAVNQVVLAAAQLDASGDAAGTNTGGAIRIGGDFHGANSNITNATTTIVNPTSSLRTDGGGTTGAGTVVLWSEAQTTFSGRIQARGGEVEVSSHDKLNYSGDVQARTLLLDPKNIIVSATAGPQLITLIDPNPGAANRNFGSNTQVLGTTAPAAGSPFVPSNRVVVRMFTGSSGANNNAVYQFNTSSGALIGTIMSGQASDALGFAPATVLTNGNFVLNTPVWYYMSNQGGASTWVDGTNGATFYIGIGNSLVGSVVNSYVGLASLALSNGNYVTYTPSWRPTSGQTSYGAVTRGNGTSGAIGLVSASNSIVGSADGDNVSSGGVVALTNGHFVVSSPLWGGGRGAATWGNGSASPVVGTLSASNSFVGNLAGDYVGKTVSGAPSVVALNNGNYVVASSYLAVGGNSQVGAITWGNGSVGTSGAVNGANSLTGTAASDQVGANGIVALTNGNYVAISQYWGGGGASTWCNGTFTTSGPVSTSNSLYGGNLQSGTALTNGNYVMSTSSGTGIVIWGNGGGGTTGLVNIANSLRGSAGDAVSSGGIVRLANGNYLVGSPSYTRSGVAGAGAVTWGNGATTGSRLVGAVQSSNSLMGMLTNEGVGGSGSFIELASNGNYVVANQNANLAGATSAGAVTWGSTATGITGFQTTSNSLYGTHAGDLFGQGIVALTNGNFVAYSKNWSTDSGIANVGAAALGNGSIGTFGAVSASNSLVGSAANDNVSGGGVTALTNGNYVVSSPNWANGALTAAGAVTKGNGTAGITGFINSTNSAMGAVANAQIGNGGSAALPGGNYVVHANSYNAGAGWLQVSSPLGNQLYGVSAGSSVGVNSTDLAASITAGTSVVLQASTDLTIASPVIATGSAGGSLTLQAGRSIMFNANVTTANGNLTAVANDAANAQAANRDSGVGSINIAAGVQLNVGTGNATLSGNGFFNLSGASAFLTTGAGLWRVWSTSPLTDTRGGLVYDFKQYNAIYGSTAPAQVTGNGFLYTLAPLVSATLTNSVTKTYDSFATATLTPGFTVSGAVDGDTVTLSGPGTTATAGTFNNKNVANGKLVTANGAVGLGSSVNTSKPVYGYSATATASGLVGNITSMTLALSGLNVTAKTYDSFATATIAGTVSVAPFSGDIVTISGSGTGTFADKKVANGKAVIVSGYTLAGVDAPNYSVGQQAGLAGNITSKALTISGLIGTDKVYNQQLTAVLGGMPLVSGLAGDTVSVVQGSGFGVFADKNVSGTAKTISISGFTLQGADAANYSAVQQTMATAMITPAPLTVFGVTTADRTYDATAVAVLTGTAGVAQIPGDNVTVTGTGVGAFASKIASSNKAVTVTGYSLSGTDAANYVIQLPSALSANVTKAGFSVSGLSATPKTYDATTNIAVTGAASGTGLPLDDVTLVAGSLTGILSSKSAGTNMPLGITGLTLTGADSANYTLTSPTVTATVYQAVLPITGLSTVNRTYDATNIATFTGTATVVPLTGDVVTVLGSTTGTFNDKRVGLNKPIMATGFSFGGADGANYLPTQPVIPNANIEAANLTIAGLRVPDRTYNANTVAVLSGTATIARLGSDDVSVSTVGTGTFSDKNSGQSKAINVTGFALGGADVSNYNLVQPSTLTGNITPLGLQIGGVTVHSKTFDGSTLATLRGTPTVTPFAGDVLMVAGGSASASFADSLAGTNKPVTALGYKLTGTDAGNYTPLQPIALTATIFASAGGGSSGTSGGGGNGGSGVPVADKLLPSTNSGNLIHQPSPRVPGMGDLPLWSNSLPPASAVNGNVLLPTVPMKDKVAQPANAPNGDLQPADAANGVAAQSSGAANGNPQQSENVVDKKKLEPTENTDSDALHSGDVLPAVVENKDGLRSEGDVSSNPGQEGDPDASNDKGLRPTDSAGPDMSKDESSSETLQSTGGERSDAQQPADRGIDSEPLPEAPCKEGQDEESAGCVQGSE